MKKVLSSSIPRKKAGPFVWLMALAVAGGILSWPFDGDNPASRSLSQSGKSALHGTASVIDGDTIEIHGQRIRLHAMDAPEARQICWKQGNPWRCGQASAQALQERINRRPVRCEVTDKDRYGRLVARCFLGSEDLGGWLVSQGLALAAPRYGKDYLSHEARAKERAMGMWAGTFVPPADWRKGQRDPQS